MLCIFLAALHRSITVVNRKSIAYSKGDTIVLGIQVTKNIFNFLANLAKVKLYCVHVELKIKFSNQMKESYFSMPCILEYWPV